MLRSNFVCVKMMYEEQQVRMSMRHKKQTYDHDRRSRKMEGEDAAHHKHLQIVDLSGMYLDTLPNPPLNLATICKLDLSNNNLQVYIKFSLIIC